jgi:hypothetical protein
MIVVIIPTPKGATRPDSASFATASISSGTGSVAGPGGCGIGLFVCVQRVSSSSIHEKRPTLRSLPVAKTRGGRVVRRRGVPEVSGEDRQAWRGRVRSRSRLAARGSGNVPEPGNLENSPKLDAPQESAVTPHRRVEVEL